MPEDIPISDKDLAAFEREQFGYRHGQGTRPFVGAHMPLPDGKTVIVTDGSDPAAGETGMPVLRPYEAQGPAEARIRQLSTELSQLPAKLQAGRLSGQAYAAESHRITTEMEGLREQAAAERRAFDESLSDTSKLGAGSFVVPYKGGPSAYEAELVNQFSRASHGEAVAMLRDMGSELAEVWDTLTPEGQERLGQAIEGPLAELSTKGKATQQPQPQPEPEPAASWEQMSSAERQAEAWELAQGATAAHPEDIQAALDGAEQ
jgi:hypothetical protein